MSVVVKDMNVPRKCTDCRFMVDGWCYAICLPEDQPDRLPLNGKPEWCPLSEERDVANGKWIKLDMHRGMEQYKCSSCGESCYVPECMGKPMYLFCPNCGAQMNGGNEKMGVIVKTLLMPERCSNCLFCETAIDPLSERGKLAHCTAAMLELSPDDIENGRPDECPLCEYREDEP